SVFRRFGSHCYFGITQFGLAYLFVEEKFQWVFGFRVGKVNHQINNSGRVSCIASSDLSNWHTEWRHSGGDRSELPSFRYHWQSGQQHREMLISNSEPLPLNRVRPGSLS